MATGPGFAGPLNVYVPSHEASGRLTVGYSRNVDKFLLPKYIRYTQAEQMTGYYLRLGAQEGSRVVTQQEYEWPDGAERPRGEGEMEQFRFELFLCHRYKYGPPIGWLTSKQASWDIIKQHLDSAATKCMTARTNRVLTEATTTANWTTAGSTDFELSANHTDTATNFAGGKLDAGTTTNLYIKTFLDKAMILVDKDTMGAVSQSDINVIINPNEADQWARSAEIHDYIKGSYWAKEEITRGLSPNNQFGLPSEIYGYKILVEKTRKITTRKGASITSSYAMPDSTVLFIARPGGIEGVYGGKDFSTLTMFHYGPEMEVETMEEPQHRRTQISVIENTAEEVVAPASGYLLTATSDV